MIDLTYPWLLILLPLPYLCYQLLPEYRQKVPAYRIPFFKLAAHAAKAHISSGSQVHSKAKLDSLPSISYSQALIYQKDQMRSFVLQLDLYWRLLDNWEFQFYFSKAYANYFPESTREHLL